MREYRIKRGFGDKAFDIFVHTVLILLSIVTIVPFLQVITISLSPTDVVSSYGLHLFPTKITFSGYIKVLRHETIWTAYLNTIVRTAAGLCISLVLYIIGAYPLSKKYLPNRKFWTTLILITMYFQGGLIPSYILITKTLHLQNSIWALVLPCACSAYTLIIVRNFFMGIPDEMEESAKIDGANDIVILSRIIVPLSKPILATVALWSLVFHWNDWMYNMMYISQQSKFVLQYVLRLILIDGQVQELTTNSDTFVNTDTMKMATLVVATLPIICTYPFLQKYFVKGVMIGAVKG